MKKKRDLSSESSSGRKMLGKVFFILGVCLITGIFYWPLPYDQLEEFSASLRLAAVAFPGGIVAVIFWKDLLKSSLAVTAGCILAIMIKVIYDTVYLDPTSHNLWPIELFFNAMFLFPVAIVGSAVGYTFIFIIKNR